MRVVSTMFLLIVLSLVVGTMEENVGKDKLPPNFNCTLPIVILDTFNQPLNHETPVKGGLKIIWNEKGKNFWNQSDVGKKGWSGDVLVFLLIIKNAKIQILMFSFSDSTSWRRSGQFHRVQTEVCNNNCGLQR